MKRYVIHLLVAVNAALLLLLAWLWIDPEGRLRNVHWRSPGPLKPDLANLLPQLPSSSAGDVGRFVATLDRPLFAQTRRPPPPPAPPAPAPPPDPLANFQLLGLFGGEQGGGIIARVEGKVQRIRLKETIGSWTVKAINGRDVTLGNGAETRTMHLAYAKPAPLPSKPSVDAVVPAAPAGSSAVPMGMTAQQRMQEDERERVRRLNEFARQAGLPPVVR